MVTAIVFMGGGIMRIKSIKVEDFLNVNRGYSYNICGRLYGLEVDDRIVSICGLRELGWWGYEVFGVHTAEEYRGKGYAGELLQRVCNDVNAIYIVLVNSINSAMKNVLRKLMWSRVCERYNPRTGNWLEIWVGKARKFCKVCGYRVWDSERYAIRDDGVICQGCVEDIEEFGKERVKETYKIVREIVR